MKARVVEIKRFAVHDGDGIRTTVFFKGCPLKCVWCHNPEGINFNSELAYWKNKCTVCGICVNLCPQKAHSIQNGVHIFEKDKCIACGKCAENCPNSALSLYGEEMSVDELMPILLEDKEFYDNTNGGVTLSGGECLCHVEFCSELLKRLKNEGVQTAVDTCGFVSRDVLDIVMPYTDVFLYDLKAYDEEVHKKCTGKSNNIILENIKYIDECQKKIEIRIPFVPDWNSDEIKQMAKFISTIKNITKVRVLPYHNYAGSKYEALDMENTLPDRIPSEDMLNDAIGILEENGIKVMK